MDERRTHGRTGAQKNNAALAHPYHDGLRCSKFGRIPSSANVMQHSFSIATATRTQI